MKHFAALNDNLVAELAPGPREYLVRDHDLPCFGVRIRTSGHKRYVLAMVGKPRITLGSANHMDCATARRAALDRISGAAAVPSSILTLEELVTTRWHDEHLVRCKPSTRRTWQSLLQSRILPHFGQLLLHDITRTAVAD